MLFTDYDGKLLNIFYCINVPLLALTFGAITKRGKFAHLWKNKGHGILLPMLS